MNSHAHKHNAFLASHSCETSHERAFHGRTHLHNHVDHGFEPHSRCESQSYADIEPSVGAEAIAIPAHSHAVEHETSRAIISMDTLGIAASSLCLVHCLAMPFIIGMLPFLGLQFLEGHQAHVVLAGFVLAFAVTAVVPGYFKHHRKDILAAMFLGLSLVLIATFSATSEAMELPLITAGNLILVATHMFNRALSRCTHAH